MSEGKIKIKRTSGFTVVPNEILRSKDLSWKAKGLMCYLLSMSEDWEVYKKDLVNQSTDGYDSMISAWKQLEEVGYIETKRVKDGTLFSSYEYIIHDSRVRDFPEQVFPEQENPQLINNYNNKKLINNKNIIKNSFEEFWELYPKKVAKEKCRTKFNGLKKTDQDKILESLPSFIDYKPFVGYNHPNPMTYLNQYRWNDEIPKQAATPIHNNATVVPTIHTDYKRVVIDHSNRD